MPAAYPLLGVIFGLVPRFLASVSLRTLATVAGVALVAGLAGITLNLRAYPFTDGVVAIFCLAAGSALGRLIPPRRRQMAVILAILSALDAVQVFAAGSGEATPSPFRAWTMFVLITPLGTTAIGFADLVVIAAIGEHWRRRGRNLVWSILPGFLGLSLADLFSRFLYGGSLPLLPFIFAGWLIGEVGAVALNRTSDWKVEPPPLE